jgi:type VI secretion system protein ImpC
MPTTDLTTQAAATTPAAEERDLLETMLEQYDAALRPQSKDETRRGREALAEFIRQIVKPEQVISQDLELTLKTWIAQIDQQLSAQLNEVMHHPDFQRLEGTWRGLHYLVHQSETGDHLKIRVLNVTKRELYRDLERAVEFDQSALFKKVYEEEYGVLGGEPYGLLVGDFEFGRHPEDVRLLKMISGVAAAAHAPFVAAADPKLFNMQRFTELAGVRDLARIFQSVDHVPWKSFRESEDSRYVALTLPRVLARLPYGNNFSRVEGFTFEECVDGKEHDKYLWMSSAWAYAARVTDAFVKDGWFARTRGVEGGGKVEDLPVHTFPTDDGDVAMKCPTEIAISDRRENELSNLGFLPLLHSKNRDFAAFLGAQSVQQPKKYFAAQANSSAELSAQFNYLLCVSRFAHYLKVMARDKIGSLIEVKDCERWLNEWINNYVIDNPGETSLETKARRPLAAARIEVKEVKERPGHYQAVAWLRPHFQLNALDVSLRLVAEVPKKG